MENGKKLTVLIIVAAFLVFLVFMGFGTKLGEEFTQEVNTLEGLTLTVDEESASAVGITYTVSNHTDKDLSYGQDYSLQKEEKGKWYELKPAAHVITTLELLWIPAGENETVEINWDVNYGKLPAGHYRILKSYSDNENSYYLAGEFNLE